MVKKQGSYELTITAKKLIRDIVLTPERIDPKSQVNDGMLTLLPGQSFKFIIKSKLGLSPEQLINYPVFWCVNQLA
jgi:beta-mannosidase